MTALAAFPWRTAAPALTLGAGVLAALGWGASGKAKPGGLSALAVAFLAAAGALAAAAPPAELSRLLRWDGLAIAWQMIMIAGALPFAALSKPEDEVPVALLLGSVLGMVLLAASRSLLMLFIGLEFMSLPAYLLVARSGTRPAAREAAVKYFFAGGTASSLFVLGLALYYGASRTLAFSSVAGPMGEAGLALMGVAALFKVGAVPMHFWLPDVYEAAPPALGGFLSTAMKSAAVLLLVRLAALSPHSAFARYLPGAGAVTALFGSVLALRQTRLARLLAYSSIAHAGNLILGVGAWAFLGAKPAGASSLYFYLAAYVLMSNGAFAFLATSGVEERPALLGYASLQPARAALLAVLLLSLGGIPPTAGFLAKFLIFWDAVKAGFAVPVAAVALSSLLSLGYYLGIVRDMYLEEAPAAAARPSGGVGWLWACALPSAVLGAVPWLVTAFGRILSL